MPDYVIRNNSIFTIDQSGTIYGAGESVDLNSTEFEEHKHKLEGVDSTVSPSEFTNPWQEDFENLQTQINNLSGGSDSQIELFRSEPTRFVNRTQLVFAHNWENFDPATEIVTLDCWALCISAQLGYLPGDRVRISRRDSFSIDKDFIYLEVNRSGFVITSRDQFRETSFNNSRWEIYVMGVRYGQQQSIRPQTT